MFGWDFEVDAWSRFLRWNLIKIFVWTCDMNSTLGSVVPLAMFLIYQWHLVINWVLVNGLYWNTSEVDWTCCFSVKIRWISFGHFWIFFISIVRCRKDDFFISKFYITYAMRWLRICNCRRFPLYADWEDDFPKSTFLWKLCFSQTVRWTLSSTTGWARGK